MPVVTFAEIKQIYEGFKYLRKHGWKYNLGEQYWFHPTIRRKEELRSGIFIEYEDFLYKEAMEAQLESENK